MVNVYLPSKQSRHSQFRLVTCYIDQATADKNDRPKPSTLLKLMNHSRIIGVGQSICICHTFYFWTILSTGDLGLREPITLSISILLFTAPIVQSFFAYRIRRFSNRYVIATFCWILSLLHIVGAVWVFVALRKSPSTPYFYKYYGWLVTMIYATGTLMDNVITVSMCWYLARRRKFSAKRTRSVIDQLVTWCIHELFSFSLISYYNVFTLYPLSSETGLLTR